MTQFVFTIEHIFWPFIHELALTPQPVTHMATVLYNAIECIGARHMVVPSSRANPHPRPSDRGRSLKLGGCSDALGGNLGVGQEQTSRGVSPPATN